MKKLLFVLYAGIVLWCGCSDTVTETVTYMINEPVFMSANELRESVNVTDQAETISDYGKICFYEGYIYISETGKGIHIINNVNPSDPQNVGFIELMGNADLAIRNGKLYADSYIDLVWFDISNPAKPNLEGRLEEVFPMALPSPDNGYGYDYNLCYNTDGSRKGVVVGWKLKERTETHTYKTGGWWGGKEYDTQNVAYAEGASGSSTGINGSMSRFALYRDHLYSVISNYMHIIDLSGSEPRKAAENVYIGENVETIFSYKDNMFMGTPTGMMIYSVADPLKPQYVRAVWHVFGCDPVAVEDDIAYVTIHSGNACGQTNNDLIIYDVSDVTDPRHIVTYAMTNPKGLGIDNGVLFLCDDGLKIFDAANPQTLMANRLAHYSGMDGFDVIPFDNVLMMIADDGLYQYDYTDLNRISRLSKLPIVKK
ncbi:MAG: hypothetical protein LBL04_12055 [Bacteroidales bacterium]|jgi:hypothetical protein|nr:hypothetical protein [Bacteroidales bacterium]